MSPFSKPQTIASLSVTITLLIVFSALAQQNPREMFERARLLDESNQNLGEAIKLYSQVAAQAKEHRSLAANAQLRVGVLYERLGRKAQAQRAYQEVVNQYSDIDEAARYARTKLAAASANHSKATSSLMVRRVLASSDMNSDLYLLSAPSPDGRYVCYRDGKTLDLAVRELATGEKRRLTANQDAPPEFRGVPQSPIFSPDSKRIAYDWRNRDGTHELRIIGLDGSGPRVLYHSEGVDDIQPAEWSWDGQQILARFHRKDRINQGVMVSVADGSVRVIKTLDWQAPGKMSLSPDGRYIAYDFPPQEDSSARDVFLLATDGSGETHLIKHPAHDRLLGWAPDGKRILFGSDRAGTMSAWVIQVADGQPQGAPELLKPDLGRIFPMGFTRKGAYYYGVEIVNNEPFIATLDPTTGQLLGPPMAIKRSSHGPFASPDWSSDGQYLVYGSVRSLTPWKAGSDILTIRSIATGKERELSPALHFFSGSRWSPDGHSILVIGIESIGNRGLYKIDANTGEVTTLLLTDPKTTWIQQAEWSPDGKAIFYNRENGVWVRDLTTGREQQLYRGLLTRFALSPDGHRLAIAREQALMVMPAAGGEPRELLTVQKPESVATMTWTPDGRQLLFGKSNLARQEQATELWRISAEGGEPQKLELTLEGLMRELRVHPDGRSIAYSSFRLRREVWVMENFLPATRHPRTSLSR